MMKKVSFIILLILSQISLFSQTGTVLVISDTECSLSVDGGTSETIKANVPKKLSVDQGEHFLSADAVVDGNKINKSEIANVEAGKQKVVKFVFAGSKPAEQNSTSNAAPAVLVEFGKINPKEVTKIKLVMTKEFTRSYKLDSLNGISFELDPSKFKKVVADLNMLKAVIPGERNFNTCAVLVISFKNGSTRVFAGNGKRFNEVVKAKVYGEYYTMTAWNIIAKHWDLKKELLCDDSDF